MKNKSGFTLIELVIVISIIGILSMMILPKFEKYQEVAKIYTHNSNVKILKAAGYMYMIENPEDKNITEEELKEYLDEGIDLNLDPIIKKLTGSINDIYNVEIKDSKVIISPDKINKKNKEVLKITLGGSIDDL